MFPQRNLCGRAARSRTRGSKNVVTLGMRCFHLLWSRSAGRGRRTIRTCSPRIVFRRPVLRCQVLGFRRRDVGEKPRSHGGRNRSCQALSEKRAFPNRAGSLDNAVAASGSDAMFPDLVNFNWQFPACGKCARMRFDRARRRRSTTCEFSSLLWSFSQSFTSGTTGITTARSGMACAVWDDPSLTTWRLSRRTKAGLGLLPSPLSCLIS